jgi:NAD(P)-dependent dehydrogenase (short-subunit alcohol dehydrogenase family)
MIRDLRNVFSLAGRAAVVTGAGQGLGQGIAEGLAQFGANVAVVDIDGQAADRVAKGIDADGGTAISLACDVRDQQQAQSTVRAAIQALGRIDILVANAGIGDRNAAEDMRIEQWDRVIDTNLRGVWLFDQEVGRHMIERGGGGSIVNVASVAGLVGLTTGNANYSASKGGVIALTRDLAVEWAKHGIRVNAIAPAQIKTPLILDLIRAKPETEAYFVSRLPLGRLADVEDIVGPVIFLVSAAAAWTTGHVLVVDGGNLAAF